jgi:hypothetical protein
MRHAFLSAALLYDLFGLDSVVIEQLITIVFPHTPAGRR